MSGGVHSPGFRRVRRCVPKGVCGIVLSLAVAACGGAGEGVSATASGSSESAKGVSSTPTPTPTSSPGLTSASEANALMADYDVRNNAAIAKADLFDTSGWDKADAGLALAADVMGTKLAQAQNEAPTGDVVTHSDSMAYAPNVAGSPHWVVVAAQRNGKPSVYGFVRDGAAGPWRQESYVITTAAPPAPAEPGAASTPNPEQIKAAEKAAAEVARTVSAGGNGAVALAGEAATMVKRLDSDRSGLGADSLAISVHPEPSQAPRVVIAQDGSVLALTSHRVTATFKAKSGSSLSHGPDFAQVLGEPGDRQELVYDFALFSLLQIDSAGATTMLGSSGGNLMPSGR